MNTFKKITVLLLSMILIISSSVSVSAFKGNGKDAVWGMASWYCEKDSSAPSVDRESIQKQATLECNEKWNVSSQSEWSEEQNNEFAKILEAKIAEATEEANNTYKITVAFSMPEDPEFFISYMSEYEPYVYFEKNGQTYSRTPLTLKNSNSRYATAILTVKGYGEYEGIICHKDNDGVPTAQSENFETPSILNISVYDGGVQCSYTNKMSNALAYQINNNGAVNYVTSFDDVKKEAWYYDSVQSAAKLGLMNGSGSMFYPNDNLSYAEAIVLASRINAYYKGLDGNKIFPTGSQPWYRSYLDYAERNGIPSIYSDYDEKITREEFVHILYAALPESEYEAINTVEDGSIPDVSMKHEYAEEIYSLYKAGIITGSDDKSFNPNSHIKRSEVAAILCRMMGEGRQQI